MVMIIDLRYEDLNNYEFTGIMHNFLIAIGKFYKEFLFDSVSEKRLSLDKKK